MNLESVSLEELQIIINEISEEFRTVCKMYYLEAKSTKQIGSILHFKKWRVYKHLNRGTWEMKKLLQTDDYLEFQAVQKTLYDNFL